jgi:hypothetical protein
MILAEVGRFYMVPHIFVPGGFYGTTRWVPVLGEKHRDKEHIGFECKRVMPDFPARPRAIWASLEKAYAGCVLKDGHICPHRGIDLRPFAKPDGTVICPGHGLRWDLNTGLQLQHHTA